jgi:hypothetical protein
MNFSGKGTCICGKEMSGGGGQLGGGATVTNRECECGIKAMFYNEHSGYKVISTIAPENFIEQQEEKIEKLLQTVNLSDLELETHWRIKDEYHGDRADWLLLKTNIGLIKIGWRKRVIQIDWSDTKIEMLIDDDVTKGKDFCHAWSYEKAIEYLNKLKSMV